MDVNLGARENRHPAFLAINPLGKVPALVVHNVKGIQDCCLFESNAITEWLNEQFPNMIQLYPSDPWECAQWQRWDMAMAEDFWPMLYSNLTEFISRAKHSRSDYLKSLPKGDPYQTAKMMKTYDGELLTPKQRHSTAIRFFQWLDLLEIALVGKKYLCGDSFTTADISVFPRITLYPLIGFLTTDKERNRYPNLIRYMDSLTARKLILNVDRTDKMLKKMQWIPWSLVEWIGNWKSGKTYRHIYGNDILKELEEIRYQQPLPAKQSSKEDVVVLYHQATWPASILTCIACLELGIQTEIKTVNTLLLEQRSANYLALNPIGEVPTACHNDKVVYDPLNVVQYLDAVFSDFSGTSLLPLDPTDRVRMRMWQGWANTCFNYQLIYPYRKYIVATILKSEFSSEESLLEALHKSTAAPQYVNDVVDLFNDNSSSEEIESKLSPYKLGLKKESFRVSQSRAKQ